MNSFKTTKKMIKLISVMNTIRGASREGMKSKDLPVGGKNAKNQKKS